MSGRIVCELPTVKVGPDNSNGAFVQLTDGRILFAYNQDSSVYWKQASTGISAIFSADGGQKWTHSEKLLFPRAGDTPVSLLNPSFVRLKDGSLAIFYSRGNWSSSLVPYMQVSPDEGLTWRDPRPCVDQRAYFSMINDRVLRLSSGRLICPISYHNQYHSPDPGVLKRDSNAMACFAFSDDEGEHWRISRNVVARHIPVSESGLQEPGVVELHPGTLWGFARTDLGRQYEFFSFDDGDTWTQAEPSCFVGACSPLAMKRIPENGWLFAVWNPVPTYLTHEMDFGRSSRFRLAYSISRDNGVTWLPQVPLENDPHGEFSHPAIFFTKQGVLVAYNVTQAARLQRHLIRLRLIPYSQL